jgi:hypothetical protein
MLMLSIRPTWARLFSSHRLRPTSVNWHLLYRDTAPALRAEFLVEVVAEEWVAPRSGFSRCLAGPAAQMGAPEAAGTKLRCQVQLKSNSSSPRAPEQVHVERAPMSVRGGRGGRYGGGLAGQNGTSF